jgi:hypothetical protein
LNLHDEPSLSRHVSITRQVNSSRGQTVGIDAPQTTGLNRPR